MSFARIVRCFHCRDIPSGIELCYDYGESALEGGEGGEGRKNCLCGTSICRGWLPLSTSATE